MDILGFIKGELLEIIEFTDDSRDTLSWRFPDEDKAIKNGAQLIVRESQAAQFVAIAFQSGRLLRHDAAFHRKQMGHGESDHAPRQGFRRRAFAGVWFVRFQNRRRTGFSA